MLDLEPRVHLEEVEAVALHQELDRPGVPVPGRHRGPHAGRVEPGPEVRVEPGRRRLLDQLLVAPLDRAVTLEEMDQRAVRVAQHLDLDVPGALDGPLHVDRRVPEGGLGAPRRGGERLLEPLRAEDQRHADPAPAGGGLQHDGIADRVGDLPGRPRAPDGAVRPGQHRDAGPGDDPARLRLLAHRPEHLGRRAHEREAGLLARVREPPVLRQEPVAGVDGGRARLPGGSDHALDREVALPRGRRPDRQRAVRCPDMERAGIGLGVHRDRADPELPAGADDPERDLAPVRHQDRVEQDQTSPGRDTGRGPPTGAPSTRATSASWMSQRPSASAAHRACTTRVVGPTNFVLKM